MKMNNNTDSKATLQLKNTFSKLSNILDGAFSWK